MEIPRERPGDARGVTAPVLERSRPVRTLLTWATAAPLALSLACGHGAIPAATTASSQSSAPLPPWRAALTDANYIAIGTRPMLDAAAPLLAHRRRQGHRVAELDIGLLSGAAAGAPTSAAIEAILQENRVSSSTPSRDEVRYLLLIGRAPARTTDPDRADFEEMRGQELPEPHAVPTFYRPKLRYDAPPWLGSCPGCAHASTYPTDQPYAEALMQQAAPSRRRVALGRIPARGPEAVQTYVRKALAYEAAAGGAWQRELLVLAGDPRFSEGSDKTIEAVAEDILDRRVPPTYRVQFTYGNPRSIYASRPDRIAGRYAEAWSRGALLTAYVGHGSSRGFDSVNMRERTYPLFRTGDISNLQGDTGRPIALILACTVGAFDAVRLSFAEELVLHPHGAVAAFASSRVSHPYANGVLGQKLVTHLLTRRAETLGEGIALARADTRDATFPGASLVFSDERALMNEHYELYALFGDPALRIAYPRPMAAAIGATWNGPDSLEVEGTGADVGATYEVEITRPRSQRKGPFLDAHAQNDWPLERVFAAMDDNHARATDNVVQRARVKATQGAFRVPLAPPKAPGHYDLVVTAVTQRGLEIWRSKLELHADGRRTMHSADALP